MGKITVRRGDTSVINVVYTAKNVPVDLTGSTVHFTVRATYAESQTDDTDALIQKTVTDHTDPTLGQTSIELTPTQTNIAASKYKYDVQVVDADGKVTTIDIGDFQVLPHVTVRTT